MRQNMAIELLVTLAVLLLPPIEADTTTDVPELGVGTAPCEMWTAARKGPRATSAKYEQWVLGYLSGVAAATRSDFLSDRSARDIWNALDARCQHAPKDDIMNVLMQMFEERHR